MTTIYCRPTTAPLRRPIMVSLGHDVWRRVPDVRCTARVSNAIQHDRFRQIFGETAKHEFAINTKKSPHTVLSIHRINGINGINRINRINDSLWCWCGHRGVTNAAVTRAITPFSVGARFTVSWR